MTRTTMTIQIHSERDQHAAAICAEDGTCVAAAYGKSVWDAVSTAAIYWNNKMERERNASAA